METVGLSMPTPNILYRRKPASQPTSHFSFRKTHICVNSGGNAVDDEDDEATEDSDELMQSKIAGQIAAGGKDGKADFDIAHTISGMKDPMPLAAHAAARLSALVGEFAATKHSWL